MSSQFCTGGEAEQAIGFHPNSGTPSGSGECTEELSYSPKAPVCENKNSWKSKSDWSVDQGLDWTG